jgi:hypothetical protein
MHKRVGAESESGAEESSRVESTVDVDASRRGEGDAKKQRKGKERKGKERKEEVSRGEEALAHLSFLSAS